MATTMKALAGCIRDDVEAMTEIVSDLESELAAEREKSSSLEDRIDELLDELNEVRGELDKARLDLRDARLDLREANEAVERLTDEVADVGSRGE